MNISLVDIFNWMIVWFISMALYIKYLGSDDKATQGFLFLLSGFLQVVLIMHYHNQPNRPGFALQVFLAAIMFFVGLFRTYEFYQNRSQAKSKRSKIIVVTKWRDTQ